MTENTQKTLNIYQKLQKARVELTNMKLKKSGRNTYSNFDYYELSDFLPAINMLNEKYGLMSQFEIGFEEPKLARLHIFNADNPSEQVTFTSETAEVEIGKKKDGTGGADRIQNIGGKQTYLRRYLFIMAYEISETDSVDAQKPKELDPELDDITADHISSAETKEELVKICKDLAERYPKMRKAIEHAYSIKKKELGSIPSAPTINQAVENFGIMSGLKISDNIIANGSSGGGPGNPEVHQGKESSNESV